MLGGGGGGLKGECVGQRWGRGVASSVWGRVGSGLSFYPRSSLVLHQFIIQLRFRVMK